MPRFYVIAAKIQVPDNWGPTEVRAFMERSVLSGEAEKASLDLVELKPLPAPGAGDAA